MTHPLDPGAPLRHADGTDFSDAERQAFFENVEQRVRNRYRDDRSNTFNEQLSFGDQLDMLWHEVNLTGTVSNTGTWFNAVKAVKESYPKDDAAYNLAMQQVEAMRNAPPPVEEPEAPVPPPETTPPMPVIEQPPQPEPEQQPE